MKKPKVKELPSISIVDGRPFKCSCGSTCLEEVLNNVDQFSTILCVVQDGDIAAPEYGPTNTDGGELSHIQCLMCGHTIAEDYNELVELSKTSPWFKTDEERAEER